MAIVEEIENIYLKIEEGYYNNEFEAHSNRRYTEEDEWKRKRELNTHAYFLFLFTRLENHIFNVSSEIITEKITSITDSKERIIWDINQQEKLHFKKRVKLLIEVNGLSYYNTIIDYYKRRNEIAHGGMITDITNTIDMPAVFVNMKRFFLELKK